LKDSVLIDWQIGKQGMVNNDKRRLVLDKAAFAKSVQKNASICQCA
jgi:hypothetical protein